MLFRRPSLAAVGLFLLVSACGTSDILTGSPINDDGRIRSSAVYVAATGQFPTVAYKDKPLYLWSRDEKPGDTMGEGVFDSWLVARP